MIPMTLAEIAAVVDGDVHGEPELTVTGPAYLDTRDPVAEGLFVAIVGERVDGHEYAAGAHAVLGSRPTDAPTVVVADPVAALGRLARHVLDRLDPTVLALTGSQGKTGTKDYLAARAGGGRRPPSPPPATATTSSASRSPCSAPTPRRRTWSSRWAPAASATSPTSATSRRRASPP